MTISGQRTKQLDIFCRVTGFTSDFLNFLIVELIHFFHRALQLNNETIHSTKKIINALRPELCGNDPSPRLGFLRGVFLANHLASTDNKLKKKRSKRRDRQNLV